MSQLHHEALEQAIHETDLAKRLVVMPLLDDDQIGPASVDVRLGTEFRVLRRTDESGLDPGTQSETRVERIQEHVMVAIGDRLWLHPNQFILGSTLEFVRFPDHLSGYVLGRSSWGRVGLLVATAIMVHPGYAGSLTLELVNHGEGPIALYPGLRIAQLTVHELPGATARAYRGKYVAPTGPQVSRLTSERADIEHLEKVANRIAAIT